MEMLAWNKELRSHPMSAPSTKPAANGVTEPSCRNTAAHALTVVRDGVITGEGPTTKGRIHFSRALLSVLTPLTSIGQVRQLQFGRVRVRANGAELGRLPPGAM